MKYDDQRWLSPNEPRDVSEHLEKAGVSSEVFDLPWCRASRLRALGQEQIKASGEIKHATRSTRRMRLKKERLASLLVAGAPGIFLRAQQDPCIAAQDRVLAPTNASLRAVAPDVDCGFCAICCHRCHYLSFHTSDNNRMTSTTPHERRERAKCAKRGNTLAGVPVIRCQNRFARNSFPCGETCHFATLMQVSHRAARNGYFDLLSSVA